MARKQRQADVLKAVTDLEYELQELIRRQDWVLSQRAKLTELEAKFLIDAQHLRDTHPGPDRLLRLEMQILRAPIESLKDAIKGAEEDVGVQERRVQTARSALQHAEERVGMHR